MLYTIHLKVVVTPNTLGRETTIVGYVGEYHRVEPIDLK